MIEAYKYVNQALYLTDVTYLQCDLESLQK